MFPQTDSTFLSPVSPALFVSWHELVQYKWQVKDVKANQAKFAPIKTEIPVQFRTVVHLPTTNSAAGATITLSAVQLRGGKQVAG